MPFVHGKSTRVLVNGYDLSGILNSAGASIEVEAPEATVFTSLAKEYQPGLADGTMSFEGYVDPDPDAAGPLISLADRIVGWIGSKGSALVFPGGVDAAGSPGRACEFYEASHEVDAAIDGIEGLTVELQATNGVSPVVSLASLLARTATSQGSAVDSGIIGGSQYGGLAYLQVTAGSIAGTSVTVKVQGSADGSTGWADLATFAVVNGAATFVPQAQVVSWAAGAAGSTPKFLRAQWTVAGGSPSFTFAVAAFRRLVAA